MNDFIKKAKVLKKPLIHIEKKPLHFIKIVNDKQAFQGVKVIKTAEFSLPCTLNSGESIIVDFGDHITGYLNLSLANINSVAQSPVKLKFTFGEIPYEVVADPACGNTLLTNSQSHRKI